MDTTKDNVYKLSRYFLLILALPTLVFLFSFNKDDGNDGLKIGKKIPQADTELTSIDDSTYSLSSLVDDNGLVVIFSCNTCPFVVGSENFAGWEVQYNQLCEKAASNKMGFVLINSNEAKREGDDSLDKMKEHAKEKNYTMPYLVDKDSKIADAFGAKTTPHVYVFNGESKLIYKGSIDNSYDPKAEQKHYLNEVYESVAAGNKPKENSTPPRGCSIKRNK